MEESDQSEEPDVSDVPVNRKINSPEPEYRKWWDSFYRHLQSFYLLQELLQVQRGTRPSCSWHRWQVFAVEEIAVSTTKTYYENDEFLGTVRIFQFKQIQHTIFLENLWASWAKKLEIWWSEDTISKKSNSLNMNSENHEIWKRYATKNRGSKYFINQ